MKLSELFGFDKKNWRELLFVTVLVMVVVWGLAYGVYNMISPPKEAFATDKSGDIIADESWTLEGSPYVITGDVTIRNNAVVTVDPGVEIQFAGDFSIIINGTEGGEFAVEGDAANHVVIKHQSSTSRGAWNSIYLNGSLATAHFSHTEIYNGGSADYGAIRVGGGSAGGTITNSIIETNTVGVSVAGDASAVTITNGTFNNNTVPLAITPEADATLSGNGLGTGSDANDYDAISIIEGLVTYSMEVCAGDGICTVPTRDFGGISDIAYVLPKDSGDSAQNLRLSVDTELEFEEGVVLKLDGGNIHATDGEITAVGTLGKPIVFTSVKDDLAAGDTNNDNASTDPIAGDWEGIKLEGSSLDDSTFSYVAFRYGGTNTEGALKMTSACQPTVTNSAFSFNKIGISFDGNALDVLTNVDNSNFFENTLYAAYTDDIANIGMEGNWWGASDGPYDPNPPCGDGACNNGSGDAVSDYIAYGVFDSVPHNQPPGPTVVNDGASAPDLDYWSDTSTMSVNWLSIAVPTNIIDYKHQLGTAAGAGDVSGWESAGTSTSNTKTGLSLTSGQTYYNDVKGYNWFAPSDVVSSDGVLVDGIDPDQPSSLKQYKSDGSTQIPLEGTADGTTVVFKFTMDDSGGSTTLYPQVEVQPMGTSYDGSYEEGSGVSFSGSPVTGTVTITDLGAGQYYHWRARVRDASDNTSSWAYFYMLAAIYDGDFGIIIGDHLEVVAEGQSYENGDGATGTPDDQTAGVESGTFYVYAVDENFYIDTSASDTITVESNDPYPASFNPTEVSLSNGVGTFEITFYTATVSGPEDEDGQGWRISADDSKDEFADGSSDSVDVLPGNPSGDQSTIVADPESVYADGEEESTITVTVRDAYENPISGVDVVLTASGSNNTIEQPSDTDTNGEASGTLASTREETKTVRGTVEGAFFLSTDVEVTNSINAPAVVRDGVGEDIDQQLETGTIIANWDSVNDYHLDGYEYAVTTDTNTENIISWTDSEGQTVFTDNSVALDIGTTYYTKVRAYNTLGTYSSAAVSDGLMVVEELTEQQLPEDTDEESGGGRGSADTLIEYAKQLISESTSAIQENSEASAVSNAVTAIAALAIPTLVATSGLGVIGNLAFVGNHSSFWGPLVRAPFSIFSGGLKKKKQPWGYVYNSVTKQPLAFAVVRLKSSAGQYFDTKVCDDRGRFTFIPPSFDFQVEAAMAGFVFPSQLVSGVTDEPFGKIYHGKTISGGAMSHGVLNIPLDPLKIPDKRVSSVRIGAIAGQVLFFVGALWSFYSLAVAPHWYNILVATIYGGVLLYVGIFRLLRGKPYGIVRNTEGRRIRSCGVYLVEKSTGRVADQRMTDEKGRYQIFASEGTFIVKAIYPGHKEQTKEVDVSREGQLISVDFVLEREKEKTEKKRSSKKTKKGKKKKK